MLAKDRSKWCPRDNLSRMNIRSPKPRRLKIITRLMPLNTASARSKEGFVNIDMDVLAIVKNQKQQNSTKKVPNVTSSPKFEVKWWPRDNL